MLERCPVILRKGYNTGTPTDRNAKRAFPTGSFGLQIQCVVSEWRARQRDSTLSLSETSADKLLPFDSDG